MSKKQQKAGNQTPHKESHIVHTHPKTGKALNTRVTLNIRVTERSESILHRSASDNKPLLDRLAKR